MNENNKPTISQIGKNIQTAIRMVVVLVIVLGVLYPILLIEIGQITLPFQSNGSILEMDGEKVGSKLIAQEFESPKFFHPRESSDSASTVDPHVTPENAYSQMKNVSKATGITENALKILLNLNIEKNKITNGLFFAPQYVNVLEVNLDLVTHYPEAYNKTLGIGLNR